MPHLIVCRYAGFCRGWPGRSRGLRCRGRTPGVRCGGCGWVLIGDISVAAGVATYGFALTASPFLQTPKKEPKTLAPPWAPR
ncbi:hypothetical protein D3X12_17775 [Pseudomonas protegens]|uniref:Uncharacterized protein n=1 Tax=Pseudomonas protegens TaxID=380021 RepID=A0ABY2VKK3_9PSED|nr:hypothetical protein CEP86_27050 [Pseudomonas protegens]QEZ52420.1 hypothetical protein D3X12_17775 [Pseudomonas protegens]QEZ55526.1 hypothetical protein D4N38_01700 [Pseudomonas protegens]QEZ63684.1 hypothetical protein D4N37_13100 [Pseudomonas protegens]TMM66107.1 hypothetical protein FEF10_01220 [Pseudomonas protegens]